MKSLPDEILAALPRMLETHVDGPTAAQVATFVSADLQNTRAALEVLACDGRAKIVRRGRRLHLVRSDYSGRICLICRAEFTAISKKTVTCSHSCGRHLAWQNQDMRERHRASITASHARPETKRKLTASSRKYWSEPASREIASEIQRQKWRDPTIKGRRLVGVERAWESPERRERQAARRLKDWENPEFRNKTVAAMRAGKRGAVKRRTIELAKAHPSMTPVEIATRLSCKVDRILNILRDARHDGIIGIRPGDGTRLRRKAGF